MQGTDETQLTPFLIVFNCHNNYVLFNDLILIPMFSLFTCTLIVVCLPGRMNDRGHSTVQNAALRQGRTCTRAGGNRAEP